MKAVLFDLDGTVSDSREGVTKCVQYGLKKIGIEEDDLVKLECFIGPPLIESYTKFYGLTEEKAKEAIQYYRERYEPIGVHECILFDGVEECLAKLKEDGYTVGLASSKPEEYCKIILEEHGIMQYFDDVVGATLDGKINTKAEVLEEVFRRWKHFEKDEICLIGDTIFDVNGANTMGIACLCVSFGFGDVEEMKKAGAVAIFDHFMELPEILKEM